MEISENQTNYQKCLELLNEGLELTPSSLELMINKIKYMVLMNDLEGAKVIDEQVNMQCGKILNVSNAFFNYYECNFDGCDFGMIGNNLNIKVVGEMMEKALELKSSLELGKSKWILKNLMSFMVYTMILNDGEIQIVKRLKKSSKFKNNFCLMF